MSREHRLNRIIERLERGEVALGGYPITCGNYEDAMKLAALDYDWVMIDSEHVRYDAEALAVTLQFLLDRRTLASGGRPPTPVVRIPANARERNQWIVKQVLDMGASGVVVPSVETVEEARAAVVAMRYPRPAGAPAPDVVGERGMNPARAARYWGLTPADYYRAADLWPLDPDGEVLFIALIESARGVKNLPEILREVRGVGAVLTGAGDLSATLGRFPDSAHADVEEAFERIASACREAGTPCGIVQQAPPGETAKATAILERRIAQGYRIVLSVPTYSDPILAAGRLLTEAQATATVR